MLFYFCYYLRILKYLEKDFIFIYMLRVIVKIISIKIFNVVIFIVGKFLCMNLKDRDLGYI